MGAFRATLLTAALGFAIAACGGGGGSTPGGGSLDASAAADAGGTGKDAGLARVDAGSPAADAGEPRADAGSEADAAEKSADAGGEAADTGAEAADAGGADASEPDAQALPTILAFTASPSVIAPGGSSTLTWSTDGATDWSIQPDVGELQSSDGTVDVSPSITTTYTLTAANNAGQVSATASVTVTAAVLFNVQPPDQTLASGLSTVIEAKATGGTKPYTVHLYRSGVDDPVKTWAGSNDGTFTYNTPVLTYAADDGAQYSFDIADSVAGTNTSNTATLNILATGIPTAAANLHQARSRHTATLLDSGQVLLAGGMGTNPGSAELYDPTAQTFTPTSHDMVQARYSHQAVLLPSGLVFLVGGTSSPSNNPLQSTELYDPSTDAFTAGPDLSAARPSGFSVTLLTAGPRANQVLIAGGEANGAASTFEIYDPDSGSIVKTGSLASATGHRAQHAAVELGDGKVLLSGGVDASGTGLASTEIYDSATDTCAFVASLPSPANAPRAGLLFDGTVFLLGSGANASATNGYPCVYDPAANQWTVIVPDTSSQFPAYDYFSYFDRSAHHTLDVLTWGPSGWVLVTGGDRGGNATDIAYVFDPSGGLGYPLPPMTAAREYHTATLLLDGTVLIAGGENSAIMNTAELLQ